MKVLVGDFEAVGYGGADWFALGSEECAALGVREAVAESPEDHHVIGRRGRLGQQA